LEKYDLIIKKLKKARRAVFILKESK